MRQRRVCQQLVGQRAANLVAPEVKDLEPGALGEAGGGGERAAQAIRLAEEERPFRLGSGLRKRSDREERKRSCVSSEFITIKFIKLVSLCVPLTLYPSATALLLSFSPHLSASTN